MHAVLALVFVSCWQKTCLFSSTIRRCNPVVVYSLYTMSNLDIYEPCVQVTGHANKHMPFCATRGGVRLCREIAQAFVSCCASSASSKPA